MFSNWRSTKSFTTRGTRNTEKKCFISVNSVPSVVKTLLILVFYRAASGAPTAVLLKKSPGRTGAKGKPVMTGISSAFVVPGGGVFFLDPEPGGIEGRQEQQSQCRRHDQSAHDRHCHGTEKDTA